MNAIYTIVLYLVMIYMYNVPDYSLIVCFEDQHVSCILCMPVCSSSIPVHFLLLTKCQDNNYHLKEKIHSLTMLVFYMSTTHKGICYNIM